MLTVGTKNTLELNTTYEHCAKIMKSGDLEVFSTPTMIALIEETSWKSVAPFLEQDTSTVGTSLSIKHLKATPIGMVVTCKTELVEIDNRRLVFNVEVFDEKDKIGEGTHERFIVNSKKFIEKVEQKRN